MPDIAVMTEHVRDLTPEAIASLTADTSAPAALRTNAASLQNAPKSRTRPAHVPANQRATRPEEER